MADTTNINDPVFDEPREHPGFRCSRARVSRQAGSERLGLSLWELPPSEAAYPYHYHLAEEELLVVLEGRPSMRTPDGWRDLLEGEVVPFLRGEQGAHQLLNRTEEQCDSWRSVPTASRTSCSIPTRASSARSSGCHRAKACAQCSVSMMQSITTRASDHRAEPRTATETAPDTLDQSGRPCGPGITAPLRASSTSRAKSSSTGGRLAISSLNSLPVIRRRRDGRRISTTGVPLRMTSISSPARTRSTTAEKFRATSVALMRTTNAYLPDDQTESGERV